MSNRLTNIVARGKPCQVSYSKGKERFIYRFRVEQYTDLLRHIGKQASDCECSLTWKDAAMLGPMVWKAVAAAELY